MKIEIVVAFLLAILLGGFIGLSVREAQEWEKFREQHKCKIVGQKQAETVTGFSTGGNVVIGSTSSQTGWLCDDGVTYWR